MSALLGWLAASCAECGAVGGESHWPGCEAATARGAAGGYAAAIRECRRRGWAVVHVEGEGFRPCRPDEPGAYADLDRYFFWLAEGEPALRGAGGTDEPAG